MYSIYQRKHSSNLMVNTPDHPRFHTDAPNQKWLTDITDIIISAGKVYFSRGLLDGMPDDAVRTLGKTEHPLIHTDRGCHYRCS